MSKFVIFAGARTGSTSLAKVLGESPDVKMAIEPFHPKFSQWNPGEKNYSEFIKNSSTMKQVLEELFTKYNAIKVLDYQFPEDIYSELLGRKDLRIIYLRRKNLVAKALSALIAHQTGEWHKSNKTDLYENLQPLNIQELEEMINYSRELNKTYETFLENNREGEYLPLFYEELYSESFDKNRKTLETICEFLDIALSPDEPIKRHMTPEEAKINYDQIYKKLPNYKEIEERFGPIDK